MNQVPAKILIVDDHPIVREGLAELINREKDLAVCGQADSGHRGFEAIEALTPDVAIIDLSLEDINGLTLIKNLRNRGFTLPVLVLSMHEESLYAERALRAGAQGYIMKREAPTRVITAIRKVLGGGVYLSDSLAARVMQRIVGVPDPSGTSPVSRLSDRELEVYAFIGQGLKTREIAAKLNLSVKTIETYREHIKEKIGLRNATELVQSAIKWVHLESARD
ncbi:MAG: response regulator transcription factor [Candidatus Hydrogenedentes bacterium]|nr:response regulator transcription factor [Candidatus Hydrogenedentota bacterium]